MDHHIQFQWECHPNAENLLLQIVENAIESNPFIAALENDLLKMSSTRLFDWLDHVVIGNQKNREEELEEAGFELENTSLNYRQFHHPGAQLPRIILKDETSSHITLALSVESISDFLMVRGMTGWVEGSPLSGYRRCAVSTHEQASLWVIERRGTHLMEPIYTENYYSDKYLEAQEKWQSRPRDLKNEDEAIQQALLLAEELVDLLDQDLAAWIILDVERKYWQSRNTAGQIQKNRQDRLGMGWANHDHHTFRSSRRHFASLVRLFEMVGFHCRERYYAGKEAGWGAQIMENPQCKLVLFLDVDLSPEEINVDFAHQPIPDLSQLGTVGLWCALHGDSILKGGMHHLEAQFLFEELKGDLEKEGVRMMDPFSSFPYLKQAFTAGEVWRVDPSRVHTLLENKKITEDQAHKFLSYGAIGSHLENLQRREGYKGFNQKNVSYIIKKTDPRLL